MIGLSFINLEYCKTLSWRRPLSYRNQSIYLQSKSMDWFLYDNGLRHERVNLIKQRNCFKNSETSYSEYNKVTSIDFPSIYVALQVEL